MITFLIVRTICVKLGRGLFCGLLGCMTGGRGSVLTGMAYC
jgi:hypothetical protein